MYPLIKKDFLVQKKTLALSLAVMVLFVFSFTGLGSAGLVISVLAVTYMFVLSAGAYEEKNNCDVLLVSLPIRKETIVLSKYASVYVFAAFGLLFNLVLSLLGELVPGGKYGFPITADILFVLFVLLTLTFSISFPLMFKLGYAKSRVANFFLYFAFIFGVNVLADRFTADPAALQFFAERPDWEWMALLIVPTIVLLIVSYFLSLRFYKNREF